MISTRAPRAPRLERQRRALTNVGGQVEAVGDEAVVRALRTAMDAQPDSEQARAHVHGFHSYPARMMPTLARRLIELLSPERSVVLDPFCGSGTVLVEARLAARDCVGLDLNPLAVALASLKTRGLSDLEGADLVGAAEHVASHGEARRLKRAGATRRYPEQDATQFEPHVLLELDGLLDGMRQLAAGWQRDALRLVLSSILTKVSRRSGDTGQVELRPRRLATGATIRLFLRKTDELAARMAEFSKLVPKAAPPGRLVLGDARSLPGVRPSSVDLVVTSPPYPGNYDYLAQHETRIRWLGFDARPLREAEMGARRMLEPMGMEAARSQYERDLTAVLQVVRRVMRAEGRVAMVVADSVLSGQALWAEPTVRSCAARAGLRWLATASQSRPHFHRPTARAFAQRGRREHVIVMAAGR